MCECNCSTWLLNIFTSVYAAGTSHQICMKLYSLSSKKAQHSSIPHFTTSTATTLSQGNMMWLFLIKAFVYPLVHWTWSFFFFKFILYTFFF